MPILAINGGEPVRRKPFPKYNTIGREEKNAVMKVLDSGRLSEFLGRYSEFFYGGEKVRELERFVEQKFGVKHAISMNSATSCLYAAVGALGLGAGDEVIVSAYSMCISATAPLLYSAIPVFADLEDDFFCLDPESIEKNITARTKAILCVDTFGQSSDMDRISAIAKKHGLKVISDSAHSVGAMYKGRPAGTIADIGIYSLNAHKVIQCGEGGIAVTNDNQLALRLQLIRNHAEAVVADMPHKVDPVNMLGQNYRLGEIESAIAIEQFKKLDSLNEQRIELSEYLTKKMSRIEGLTPPKVRKGCTHVYYLYPIKYDEKITGLHRKKVLDAVKAEGIPMYLFSGGYVRPMYYEPIFGKKKVFKHGYPFALTDCKYTTDYGPDSCPVVEKLFRDEMIVLNTNYPPLTTADMDDVANAFEKVLSNVSELA